MEGARFLALLLYFEGRVEGRGAIAPLKREALLMYIICISVFFKAGTPVHCTVFPTCVYRLSPLESKIFAANKLRLWT